ncbi:hypothetical protein [Clostridium sp.]|uniref:hypothetical protein n=1 Tax=Clostridium sp. TaxID=1506 RepID=UPI003D6D2CAA
MTLDEKILELKDEILKGVEECIKTKSVEDAPKENMPFGEGVQKVFQYSLDLSKKLGFKTVNLDNMIGYVEYGEGKEMIAVR